MEVKRQVVETDENGYVKSFKVETCEWNPPPLYRTPNKKSTQAIKDMNVGDVKRIVHPEVKCSIKTFKSGDTIRSCTLSSILTKQRKLGWEIEYYHEADHVAVVRRLK